MYKNFIFDICSSPCSERAQDTKSKMDKILIAIGASMLVIKLNLENSSKDLLLFLQI